MSVFRPCLCVSRIDLSTLHTAMQAEFRKASASGGKLFARLKGRNKMRWYYVWILMIPLVHRYPSSPGFIKKVKLVNPQSNERVLLTAEEGTRIGYHRPSSPHVSGLVSYESCPLSSPSARRQIKQHRIVVTINPSRHLMYHKGNCRWKAARTYSRCRAVRQRANRIGSDKCKDDWGRLDWNEAVLVVQLLVPC